MFSLFYPPPIVFNIESKNIESKINIHIPLFNTINNIKKIWGNFGVNPQLNCDRVLKKPLSKAIKAYFRDGGLSRNRTNDTRIFSPLLYQLSYETTWLREKDLNQRPPGYEPDELPDCSIPRCELRMAEKLGFEPRRRANDLPVFKTGPFSHLGTSPFI